MMRNNDLEISNGVNPTDTLNYLEARAKKITSALYRVTDLFSEKEPLKWSLRREAIEVLERLLSLRHDTPKERSAGVEKISALISKLISILELAEGGSFISRLNFEVLEREYLKIKEMILNSGELLAQNIESNLIPEPAEALENKGNSIGHESIGHSIGHDKKIELTSPKNKPERIMSFKDTPSQTKFYETSESGEAAVVNGEARKGIIIEYLKEKDWVSLGELSSLFQKGLSEKTLQRDIADLASAGLIERQGEKRWRRYALNPVRDRLP